MSMPRPLPRLTRPLTPQPAPSSAHPRSTPPASVLSLTVRNKRTSTVGGVFLRCHSDRERSERGRTPVFRTCCCSSFSRHARNWPIATPNIYVENFRDTTRAAHDRGRYTALHQAFVIFACNAVVPFSAPCSDQARRNRTMNRSLSRRQFLEAALAAGTRQDAGLLLHPGA